MRLLCRAIPLMPTGRRDSRIGLRNAAGLGRTMKIGGSGKRNNDSRMFVAGKGLCNSEAGMAVPIRVTKNDTQGKVCWSGGL